MYLRFALDFSEDTSVAIYHAFIGLFGFASIFGGILADQFTGKFKAILWIILLYEIGLITLPLASLPPLNLPQRYLAYP